MKLNIDLTENRDFQRINIIPSITQINKVSVIKVNDYNDYMCVDSGGILQGNATERALKRICKEFNTGNICDCCGISLKPYTNSSLCDKCDKRIQPHTILW